jgi:hypothetical protein
VGVDSSGRFDTVEASDFGLRRFKDDCEEIDGACCELSTSTPTVEASDKGAWRGGDIKDIKDDS